MANPDLPNNDAVNNDPFTDDLPQQSQDDENNVNTDEDLSNGKISLLSLKDISYSNKNVTMSSNVFKPAPKPVKGKVNPIPLGAFNHVDRELADLEESTFIRLAGSSSFNEEWRDTVALANEDDLIKETYLKSLTREDGDWNQDVEYEGEKIRALRPSISTKGDGGTINGIKALTKLQGMLGIGSMIEVPLWHSGIWVSIKAPTDIQLLNMYEKIGREKIELGKSTAGLLFTNSSTYVNKHLMDLITDLVYETSIKDYTPDMLGDVVKMNDLPILCWAIAYTMYPKGYPYRRPCVVDTEKCQEVIKSLLDIGKLLWVDRSKLNEKQIKHMQRVPKVKRTLKEIEQYQDEFSKTEHSQYKHESGFTVVFKQPTINEHLTMGENWINEMDETVRQVFSDERNQANINEYINERASLTILRNYGHYVKHFVFDDGDKTTDQTGIEMLLNGLAGSHNAIPDIINGINDFIDASGVAIIAVPRNPCPKCGQKPKEDIETHPWLLPLDAQRLFFRLRDRRLQQGIPA